MKSIPAFRREACSAIPWLLLWLVDTMAQTVAPSNNSQDLPSAATSPRFLLNGTEFPNIPAVQLAPLGEYADMSHSAFLQVQVEGHLANIGAFNANNVADQNQFSYISCDPAAYTGNLGAGDVFDMVANAPRANIIILYSETSDHCIANGLDSLPTIGGILTTTDPVTASRLANLNLNAQSSGMAFILPDLNSYTNTSNGGSSGGVIGQSPTTAVAMIILYSITGIITALFVVIIVTGAIRAHRHPERYGPRNIVGRGRQSRAKGIARAMLETLPIVKFGDHQDLPTTKPTEAGDIEMNASSADSAIATDTATADKAPAVAAATPNEGNDQAPKPAATAHNADGTDDDGHLGCSICTEDFTIGEEVRVLPCNHKFHPDCVDPWLLNVSGTCPLCRIDLRSQGPDGDDECRAERQGSTATAATASTVDGQHDLGDAQHFPPPLAGTARRDTVTSHLRHLAAGSREERIAGLRRLRQERSRDRAANTTEDENERGGLARRFRERFRIRTERRGTVPGETTTTTLTHPEPAPEPEQPPRQDLASDTRN